jgi:hypothetical protein
MAEVTYVWEWKNRRIEKEGDNGMKWRRKARGGARR